MKTLRTLPRARSPAYTHKLFMIIIVALPSPLTFGAMVSVDQSEVSLCNSDQSQPTATRDWVSSARQWLRPKTSRLLLLPPDLPTFLVMKEMRLGSRGLMRMMSAMPSLLPIMTIMVSLGDKLAVNYIILISLNL